MEYRIEKDSLGEKKVPKTAYYGIHTLRAKNNFEIVNDKIDKPMIRALVMIKKSATEANFNIGLLDETTKNAIINSCDEILAGKYHNQFLTTCIQGGSGYSMIMNSAEVIANRANEILGGTLGTYDLVSLNQVNLNQSVADTMPTAIKIASINLTRSLVTELKKLTKIYQTKSKKTHNIEVANSYIRTSNVLERDISRILDAMNALRNINVGYATINENLEVDENYIKEMVYLLTKNSHIQFIRAQNLDDNTLNLDTIAHLSSVLKTCAVNLSKACSELNFLDKSDIIHLTRHEETTEPFILETVKQATVQAIGNDLIISLSSNSDFSEVNIYQPLIMFRLFNTFTLLKNSANALRKKVIPNITE